MTALDKPANSPQIDLHAIRKRAQFVTDFERSGYVLNAPEADRRALLAELDEMAKYAVERSQLLEAIGYQGRVIARLREGLLKHACFCGPTDLEPAMHAPDCQYRVWATPPQ